MLNRKQQCESYYDINLAGRKLCEDDSQAIRKDQILWLSLTASASTAP